MEAMGLFADDAAFGGRGCGRHPAAVCLGKEEIGHYTFEAPDRPGYPDVFRRPATDRAARDQYLAEGRPLHTGANPAAASYGRTLERMAKESPEEFYQGGV